MQNETHIYALIDPVTNFCRYIGKTKKINMRLDEHYNENAKTYKANWIKSLKIKGLKPILESLEITDSNNWQESEKFWISYFKFLGANLTNNTNGGDGSNGCKWTTEQKLKLIEIKAATPNVLKGTKLPQEMKDRIAETLRNKAPRPREIVMKTVIKNIGKKRSAESKLRMSEAQKIAQKIYKLGTKASEETKIKQSEGIKLFYKNNPDRCKERSDRAKKQWEKRREGAVL
jgi:hypothetical protein